MKERTRGGAVSTLIQSPTRKLTLRHRAESLARLQIPRADALRHARTLTTWLLAVTTACLPLYVVRWHYWKVPTTLLETLILLTSAAYAVTFWSEKRLPSRTPFDIPILLWLLAGLLGIVAAPDHAKAMGIYRAYFVEAVAVFYIAIDLLRDRAALRIFLTLAAIGISAMAIGQIVTFAYVAAHHQLQLGDAPAFLNTSANAVAMFLEPPLAFAVGFAAFPWGARARWAAAIVVGLVSVAMILTLSRAGYLAMGALAIVLILSIASPRLRGRVIALLALLVLIVLEVPFINQRLLSISASAGLRSSIYSQALHMLLERPILGAGIDGFPVRVAQFRPGTQTIELYPHDIWLTTWSEVGLLGVIVFAVIAFGLLWRGVRALHTTNQLFRPILWGCVGALVLFLVHGLFDSPYWKNDLSVEFWLVAALEVVAIRGASQPVVNRVRTR
jgi:putative inorganic carbon (hco3(-)) transporter